jgi:hypothetical protein
VTRAGAIFDMGGERKTPPGKHRIRRRPVVPRAGVFLPTSRQKRLRRIAMSVGLEQRGRYEEIIARREANKRAKWARRKNRMRAA